MDFAPEIDQHSMPERAARRSGPHQRTVGGGIASANGQDLKGISKGTREIEAFSSCGGEMVIEHGGPSCYYDERFARLTDAFGGHRIELPVTCAHVVVGPAVYGSRG